MGTGSQEAAAKVVYPKKAPFKDGHLLRRRCDVAVMTPVVTGTFSARLRFVCFHTKGRHTFAVMVDEQHKLYPLSLRAFSELVTSRVLNGGAVSGRWRVCKEGMFYGLEVVSE